MEIIYFLLPASLLLALIGLAAYFWAVKSGQFDDLDTPSLRMLSDEEGQINKTPDQKEDRLGH